MARFILTVSALLFTTGLLMVLFGPIATFVGSVLMAAGIAGSLSVLPRVLQKAPNTEMDITQRRAIVQGMPVELVNATYGTIVPGTLLYNEETEPFPAMTHMERVWTIIREDGSRYRTEGFLRIA